MLKSAKEFDFVYKNSHKFRTEMLDICVLKPNLMAQFYARFRRMPCNLVGFSVSKKVGIAVERNLIKRRFRAICREFFKVANSSLREFGTNPKQSAPTPSLRGEAAVSLAIHKNPMDCHDLTSSNLAMTKKDNRTNLICIFIAKNKILQMPFSALKDSIFATLKKQMRFVKNNTQINRKSHNLRKSSVNLKGTNSANLTHTKAGQNENR